MTDNSNVKTKLSLIEMFWILIAITTMILTTHFYFTPIDFLCSGLVILILLLYRSGLYAKGIVLLYYLILIVLLKGGGLSFDFIPQAKALLDLDQNVIFWLQLGHPHAIRLLLAYPGYIVSQVCDIDLNIAFSYYVVILFYNDVSSYC